MSSSRGSDQTSLRFGVELELVLRSKNKTHDSFDSIASELHQHLQNAGISNHIGDIAQKAHVTPNYDDWTIIQDSTLPSKPDKNLFGIELVSPIFHFPQMSLWLPNLHTLWHVLTTHFSVHPTPECSTHVHISPSPSPSSHSSSNNAADKPTWTLPSTKSLAKSTIHFERALDALVPGHRRTNPYCMSNRRNAAYATLSQSQIFADIDAAKTLEELGERMCSCSRESVHAKNLMMMGDEGEEGEGFEHPHFKWNFTRLTEGTKTVEFRLPPASRGVRDTVAWVVFTVMFAQWAVERGGVVLEADAKGGKVGELGELKRVVVNGARGSGVAREVVGWVEGLFEGVRALPAVRVDLKGVGEGEVDKEAGRMGMEVGRWRELFGYE
ncbi:putative amidoligase enzyme-domain-containing protein [Chaetomium sp. MPI-SDFR-AT-0129]|nr:putative amidoligase enzyme-domain-containing protein [Chaetomium sp. MPI-SDFR-AT-0129]